MSAVDKIKKILEGINVPENEDLGYWPTSDGVKFGQEVLDEAVELVRLLEDKIAFLEGQK